ncbi:3-phosphoshikimate 1-carboxyvinyltransferase [Candidatus Roizmanbacteria bacterium]|nr:3-phosphoshikimate 1-carboxyvinyltransferase [Candidatus Roizmanbacteria bacterium]
MKTIEITVPGSKSLTNRAIIMASLSSGLSKISNISNSIDSRIMIKAIKKLGVKIKVTKKELQIMGNQGIFKKFNGIINVGSAGTVARFLTALITLVPGRVIIKKSKRMRERPIKELADAMKNIRTGEISIKGNVSSQFVSALLMIAPVLENGLAIKIIGDLVSKTYVEMTIKMMKKFEVKVENEKNKKFVMKNQQYKSVDLKIEADASGASYFFGMAAVTGKRIRVNIDPKSVQGDLKFADILGKMGCLVIKNCQEQWIEVEGPKVLKGITVNMNSMPDTAQTLAIVAAFAKGKTIITGLSTLKVKETDRLLALKKELSKMKIKSHITDDSIVIIGGNPQKAVIETYGDHRMAMAFAVAKSRIPKLIIKNPVVVNKSFPEFWKEFKKV